MTSPVDTLARARLYLAACQDPSARLPVERWLSDADASALEAAFGDSLRFGTAGIRAARGPGTTRINAVSVARAADALCTHLEAIDPDAARDGLCVGFDGRHQSRDLAAVVAEIAAAHGLRCRVFSEVVPTPALAHATRRAGAAAGVMVTASHNPPEDSGLKVFLRGGRQLTAPHDAAIAALLRARDDGTPCAAAGSPVPLSPPLGSADLEAYLADVLAALPSAAHAPAPRVTYSAMCGVGTRATRHLLERLDVRDVHEVPKECRVDPDFAGLRSPNPESREALTRALALARASESDLLLVHDPDADRLAVAVRHAGEVVPLTGDAVGCLLADYLLTDAGPGPHVVITTRVSSRMLAAIAEAHGAHHDRVPTGLKWVCARGRELALRESARFLFGYEEALGYCLPSLGDDKDGVAALGLVVRLHQRERARGGTLVDALLRLYARHGVHRTTQATWRFDRRQDQDALQSELTRTPPASLAGQPLSEHRVDEEAGLLALRYGDALDVVLRPSGTEPKLKAYLEVRRPPTHDTAAAIADADRCLDHASAELNATVQSRRGRT